jgi:hypothetical protein
MKKIYIILFVLACSFGYLQAQGWYVYDGSQNPLDAAGWAGSSINPGPNMVEEVIDDPEITGNKFFLYVQPDELSIPEDQTARKLYVRNFDAGTATSGKVTVVARLKGYGVDTLPTLTEIQLHNSATSFREYLQINTTDSILTLARSGAEIKVDADLNKWHIYRFVLDGSDSTATVYLDEDPTPVVSGANADGTTSHYLRMGDGGGARTAGYTDWLIIDTTGAYMPGEGVAIPDSLSTETGGTDLPGFGKNLLFITRTDQVGPTGNYPDSLFVVDLKNAGFNVTVPDYSIVADASAELKTAADASDILVIGRAVNSGDFQEDVEKDFWNKQQKPVVNMSNYLARNNRLDWIASSSVLNYARFGDLPGKVLMPDDAAFDGVTIPSDSIIVFAQNNIGMITMNDSVQGINNGAVLVELINGPEAYEVSSSADVILDTVQLSDYDGNPLMIRWEPLDTMYQGGMTVPYGWRTFITGGDDHDWDVDSARRNIATYIYSPEMKKAFINECVYLLTLPQPVIDNDATLSALSVSVGTLSPDFSAGVNNYVVSVPEGTTSVTITATANSANAELVGDGEFTEIPGTAVITVTSQAGTENIYNIVFQLEVDPGADCIAGGTGTLEAAIAVASAGDTIVLCNDAEYVILSAMTIDKKIVIRAAEYPTLPGLENMPLINNTFGINPIFQLADGADLHLIGIDIHGGNATNIINPRPGGIGGTVAMRINRCRLHDTSNDLINSADATQETVLSSFTLMNSFLYNSGTGHGAYVRNFYGTNSPYVFEDITFWNLGQQFLWVSHNTGDGEPQEWMFNHMTGHNLSTDVAQNKELFGNSDAAGPIDLTMKNTILSTQVSTFESSLAFYQTAASGDVITLSNLALYNVQPVIPRTGSDPTPVDPLFEADPQFADAANGDFTVGNSDYHAAADDGSVLGARYWAPGFVDDMSDVATGLTVAEYSNMEVKAYPLPFNHELTLEFNMDKPGYTAITILDISGRAVRIFNDSYGAGQQNVTLNLSELDAGLYFYSIRSGEQSTSGRILKGE